MTSFTTILREFFGTTFHFHRRVSKAHSALRAATLRMVHALVILSLLASNFADLAQAAPAASIPLAQNIISTHARQEQQGSDATPSSVDSTPAAQPVVTTQLEETLQSTPGPSIENGDQFDQQAVSTGGITLYLPIIVREEQTFAIGETSLPSASPVTTSTLALSSTPTNTGTTCCAPPLTDTTPITAPLVRATAANDLVITSTATLTAGHYVYNHVLVTNNATLFLQGDTTTGTGVTIEANTIQIDAGASISADELGYGEAAGPGAGQSGYGSGVSQGAGAGHGGWGVDGSTRPGDTIPLGGAPYGSFSQPTTLGSGGGRAGCCSPPGSSGGGAIHLIVSGTLAVDGAISANGKDGSGGNSAAGGGAGGSIWLEAGTLAGTGTIQANGGSVPPGDRWGVGSAGGGGRIALEHTTNSFTGSVQAYSGAGGTVGGPGTIYWAPTDTLLVDNNNNPGRAAGLVEGSYDFAHIDLTRYGHLDILGTGSSLTLNNGVLGGDGTGTLAMYGAVHAPISFVIENAKLDVRGQLTGATDVTVGSPAGDVAGLTLRAATPFYTGTFTFNSLIVNSTGQVTLVPQNDGDTDYTDDLPFVLNANSFTIAAGGLVTADGLGYSPAAGPGTGQNAEQAGGGGHGGWGAAGRNWLGLVSGEGGTPYGSVYQPTTLGSGGGSWDTIGGPGGGAIHLIVNNTLTLDGILSTNGLKGNGGAFQGGGGGAGGSIWIETGAFVGNGLLRANGANGGDAWGGRNGWAGAGAGGRIAIDANDSSGFTGTVEAHTGNEGYLGGPGTIYWTQANRLQVDNNGVHSRAAGLVEGHYNFAGIELTRYGHLDVLGTASSLTLNSNTVLGGDGTGTLSGLGTINTPTNLVIENATLDVRGVLAGPTDITVGSTSGNPSGLTLRAGTPLYTGTHTFNSLTVNMSGTVTLVPVVDGDTDYTDEALLELHVTILTIDVGGTVNADNQGYPSQTGPGQGVTWAADFIQPGGAGHGGWGGSGAFGGAVSGAPYDSVFQPTMMGSGGGAREGRGGGTGGGALKLVVDGALTVNGTLSARGQNGQSEGAGGGAGGSIWLQAGTLAGTGAIRANGGNGNGTGFVNRYGIGGGGAGGRVALHYGASSFSGVVEAIGGEGGQYGGPGTVYWAPINTLVVDNHDQNSQYAGLVSGSYAFAAIDLTGYGHLTVMGTDSTLQLLSNNNFGGDGTSTLAAEGTVVTPPTFAIDGLTLDVRGALSGATDVTVDAKGGLKLHAVTPLHTGTHTFNSLTVNNTGTLMLAPYDNGDIDYSNDKFIDVVANSVTVAAGGIIHSDELGYAGTGMHGKGPGGGEGNSCETCAYVRGAGGSYGGRGGNGSPNFASGVTYGNPAYADLLGSAGGAGRISPGGYPHGASGGGAIHLTVNGALTVDGRISANGAHGSGGKTGLTGFGGSGGGSGGSLQLVAQTLAGGGSIQASGGSSKDADFAYGSGGGGGRIVVAFANFAYGGQFLVSGGIGYSNGKQGTINGLLLPPGMAFNLTGTDWREGAITACMPCVQQITVGGPINTLTGALEYSATDLSFPVLGGTMTFQRFYSTAATELYTTALGPGWTHNLDTRLILPTSPGGVAGQALFKAHSANQYIFYDGGDGSYTAHPGVKATLTFYDNKYTLVLASQATYTFDAAGKLTTWADALGHTWTYSYDTNNRISKVAAGARFITLTYDAASGRIASVADHSGRTVTYGYDPATGDLTAVVDVRGKSWRYEYGAMHRLTRALNPLGETLERTEYDAQGRAVRQYNGENKLVVELAYNADGAIVTDALGNVAAHDYSSRNVVSDTLDALNGTTAKTFDHHFHLATLTDELQHTTALQWSDDGANLTQVQDALSNQTKLRYDDLNNLKQTTDPLGHTTVFTYAGTLLTSSTDTLSNTTKYTYTTAADAPQPPNLLKRMTDPAGLTTAYHYNEFGQVLQMTDAQGRVTTYTYDALGRPATTTDVYGLVMKNEYDAAGNLVRVTRNVLPGQSQNYQDAYNLVTAYTYDDAGRMVRTTDTLSRTNWTCYDNAGRVIRSVANATGDGATPQSDPCDAAQYTPSADPAYDRISTTVYDAAGNVIATIGPDGVIQRTYYDKLNRPWVVVQNLVGQPVDTPTPPAFDPAFPDRNVRSETVYDAAGNVTKSSDNAGRVAYTCYDANNRPVKTVQNPTVADPCVAYTPDSGADQDLTTQTVYDEAGNVIATVDAVGLIQRTYYDANNRPLIAVQNLVGQAISDPNPPAFDPQHPDRNIGQQTFYDATGRVYRTLDLTTQRSDWTCYDASGRMSRTVVNATVAEPCAPGMTHTGNTDQNLITSYHYDVAGRQFATTAPDGQVTRTYYDATNRRLAVVANFVGTLTDPNPPAYDPAHPDQNITTRYEYDALGRVVQTITAADSPQARNDWTCYDALGRTVKTVQNASGANACANSYTPSGNPDEDVLAQTIYDAMGDAIATLDPAGKVTRTYYDALHRPLTVVNNLRQQPVDKPTPPVYDPALPDQNVRQTLRYDAAGRTFELVDNAGMVTHTDYDLLDRAVAVIVNYVQGGAADDQTNLTTRTVYDRRGNVASRIDAKGIVTLFEYDARNRLTAVVENYKPPVAPNADTNVRTEYTYDAHGNRLTIKDANQHVTTFTYDALDRLLTERDPLGQGPTHRYTLAGQPATLADANGATTAYTYDGVRRLQTIDYSDATADVNFTYDALNRVAMTEQTGGGAGVTTTWTHDGLARPLQITASSGPVSYVYDRLGLRRLLGYPDGKQAEYAYDGLDRLASVKPVGSGAWAESNTSYNYTAFGAQATVKLPNGVTTAYSYDNAHRLTRITHATANATLAAYTYTLDAVGNRVRVVEVLQQPAPMPPPAAHWQFEEGAGSTAGDQSGNGNVGRLENGATWGSGVRGGGLALDGVDDLLRILDSPSLSLSGDGLTLEAWVKLDSINGTRLLIYKEGQYALALVNGQLTYADSLTWNYAEMGFYGNVPAGVWTHVAVTFDGSAVRFYINARLVGTKARTGSLTDNDRPVCLGSAACGNAPPGVAAAAEATAPYNLDEVAVYSGTLNAPAIQARYQQYAPTQTVFLPLVAKRAQSATTTIGNARPLFLPLIAGESHTRRATTALAEVGVAPPTVFGATTVALAPAVASAETGAEAAALTSSVVTTTISYTYDALYRLTRADYSTGEFFAYTYDAVGNRLSETRCLGAPTLRVEPQGKACTPVTNSYTYDNANRLTSVNGVAYTWDDNGNLLNDGTSTYTYDAANRLARVSNPSAVSSYQYNGLGDRVAQTVNGVTTNYTLDLNAGLTQVLSDGTNAYLYGTMRIGELQPGGWAYHLGDALGSVRQLTDASGSVTLSKNFEPYGTTLSSAESGSSVYAFTGEQFDMRTGLTYLRARYYNAGIGRFMTRDPWQGDFARPMSYNAWLYVYGNVINLTDPSGWCGKQGQPPCPPTPTPTGTPTPPVTATQTPAPRSPTTHTSYPPVVYDPCMDYPQVPCRNADDGDFDFVEGSVTGYMFLSSDLDKANSYYDELTSQGCTISLTYNAAVWGEEVVYDYVHWQKAKFSYTGVALASSAILNLTVEGSVYSGEVDGFRNKSSVADYKGFAESRSGSISAGKFGISGGLGVSIFSSTGPDLEPTGIGGSSISLGGSMSAGLATVMDFFMVPVGVSGYAMVTFYQLRGPIEYLPRSAKFTGGGPAFNKHVAK